MESPKFQAHAVLGSWKKAMAMMRLYVGLLTALLVFCCFSTLPRDQPDHVLLAYVQAYVVRINILRVLLRHAEVNKNRLVKDLNQPLTPNPPRLSNAQLHCTVRRTFREGLPEAKVRKTSGATPGYGKYTV